MALIGTSDYLRGDRNIPAFTDILSPRLARLHVSTWFEMVQLNTSDKDSFLPQLGPFWKDINSSSTANDLHAKNLVFLDDDGKEITKGIRLNPISFLLNFRNTIAHKTSLTEYQLHIYSKEAERTLRFVLDRLSWLWDYTLIARFEVDRVTDTINLRGAKELIEFPLQSEVEVILQSPQRDRELLLLPFCITQIIKSKTKSEDDEYQLKLKDGEVCGELVVLEDIQKKHLLYLSPATGEGYLNRLYHPLWNELNTHIYQSEIPCTLMKVHPMSCYSYFH